MSNMAQTTKLVAVTPPAAIVDNNDYTTAEIDTAGFDHAQIIVQLGATDIAMVALKVTESDASGSGHADVSGLDFDGDTDIDGSTATLPSATDDDGFFVFDIDLRGRKRYLDVTATAGNGAAGTFASILAILSRPDEVEDSVSGHGAVGYLRV